MPRVVIRFTEYPRANRHWTDEEHASRFLGELHAMDCRDARFGSIVRGALTLLLFVGLMIFGMAL